MKRVLVRLERCLGCHTCELACAVAHSKAGTLPGAVLGGERPPIYIKVEQGGNLRFPAQCRHCTDAACIHACMSGALHRNEESGVVLCDQNKCVGCWMCVMTCPFGAISESLTHKAAKCDLCYDIGDPRCAAACPTGALSYEEVGSYDQTRRKEFIVNYLISEMKGAM
ncbi:MAG: 4Fe-4S dicluster domain-containing protein [Syntrophomonadaceae bacterium]|nr:4Fe-4S dicluster domain-containing protein [Syntrophomonadaceae bacterium]